jgi:hypothetical protein
MIRAEGWISRRKIRRRWVVIFWAQAALMFGLSLVAVVRNRADAFDVLLLVQIAFTSSLTLGGLSAGGLVKSFGGSRAPALLPRGRGMQALFAGADETQAGEAGELDERETRRRDSAHFTAYACVRWLGMGLFGLYAAMLVFAPAQANRFVPSFLFLLVWMVWSLPQSIILWTEPDLDEVEVASSGGTVAPRRDKWQAGLSIVVLLVLAGLMIYAVLRV